MKTITVHAIISGQLPEKYKDKVFWFAEKIVKTVDTIDIYIDNKTSITAFDSYATELNVKPISFISSQAHSGSWDAGEIPVLVSSGSFLWINEKLVVTQRTADTKFDPLAWTTPAGRCDDTPVRTGLKETIEEIRLESVKTGKLMMPSLAQPIVPNTLQPDFYPVLVKFPSEFKSKMTRVRTWVDNRLVEDEKLWFMYDKESNTLEFRLPLISKIDEKLSYTNPEFHTDVQTLNFSELEKLHLVPAVKQLLSENVCGIDL